MTLLEPNVTMLSEKTIFKKDSLALQTKFAKKQLFAYEILLKLETRCYTRVIV